MVAVSVIVIVRLSVVVFVEVTVVGTVKVEVVNSVEVEEKVIVVRIIDNEVLILVETLVV